MKNLTIKQKLTFTFMIIGVLVFILAGYSISSITKASNGFIGYREMSKDTVLAAQVQSNMLIVSMSVKDYISNPTEKEIEKFNENFKNVEQVIDAITKKIQSPQRLKLVKELKQNAQKYKNTFFLISTINQERDDIIANNLERNGERIEKFLTTVMEKLQAENKYNASIETSKAIKLLLLARVYTTKFLNTYSKNDLDKVKSAFDKLSQQIKLVEKNIDDSFLKSRLMLAKRFIMVYKNGSIKIEEIVSERNDVIDNRLNKISLKMVSLAESIKTSIKKEQDSIGEEVGSLNKSIANISIGISIVILVFIIVLSFVIPRNISKLIDTFQAGLINFFKYLNKESNDVQLISLDSKDEIGNMSKIINKNILNTKSLIEQDSALIEDVKRVVNLVKEGRLKQKVEKSTQNQGLEELKVIFNEMLEVIVSNVARDLNSVTKALSSYQSLDFTYKIENAIGKTALGLNTLADIINKMLADNKSNGLALDESSDLLLEYVDKLNKNAINSAAALEETAAAIEDITNKVANNTQNISQMSSYAKNLSNSAEEGEELSSKTTLAMNEINEEVNSIYEAISVIDQIAFQTNILSLNAAVEAATAGEAGKGFAVVAQEVRNLASRSAEAASEIKQIVENATQKANMGKNIAEQMISGYSNLKENISKTTNLISSIEENSKEQKTAIEQINSTVNTLDYQTQENANISNKTHTIAKETDTIAKLIVSDVNEKEFIGKDTIEAKVI